MGLIGAFELLGVFIVGGSFSASPLMSFFIFFVFSPGTNVAGGVGWVKTARSGAVRTRTARCFLFFCLQGLPPHRRGVEAGLGCLCLFMLLIMHNFFFLL